MIHEMMHILAFSADKLHLFIDSNNGFKRRENVLQKVKRGNKEALVITSPKVIQECNKHFDCECDGLDVEADGG